MDHRTELQALVEVARVGNVRRAADRLGVSQSTLSEAITRLEKAYDAPLFTRDQRGARPTAFGEVIVDAAARSLVILDNARREVGLMQTFERGRLAIGADPSIVAAYLVPAIARVLKTRPRLRFRVRTADTGELVQELRDKRIDFFVGLKPDGPLSGLDTEDIEVPVGVPFCRHGHPLASIPPQGVRVVLDYPAVGPRLPDWFYERIGSELQIDDAALEALREEAPGIELDDSGAVRALVKQSDAIALAPYETIRADVEAGELVVLGVPEDQQKIHRTLPMLIATLGDRTMPPAAPVVISELRSVIEAATSDGVSRSGGDEPDI